MSLTFEEVYEKYQKGELIECEKCNTTGIVQEIDTCPDCEGLGYLNPSKKNN